MSKKVKYIISISLVVVIMSLGIITLILGLVPVGGNDAINLPNDVYIYTNLIDDNRDKLELHRREDSGSDVERINKIFDLFNRGFEQKALSAMFKGELGAGLEFVDNYANNIEHKINKYKDNEEYITFMFLYNEEQHIQNVDTTWTYKRLCFTVSKSTEWQEIIIGLPTAYNDDYDSGNEITFRYYYKGKMVTSELYNYANLLIDAHKQRAI